MTETSRSSWRIMPLPLMAVSFFGHFNRVGSIAVAGTEHLIPDLGISAERMGVVYSAFLVGYTLLQTPAGMFADRFRDLDHVGDHRGNGAASARTHRAHRHAGSSPWHLPDHCGLQPLGGRSPAWEGASNGPLHPSSRSRGLRLDPAAVSRACQRIRAGCRAWSASHRRISSSAGSVTLWDGRWPSLCREQVTLFVAALWWLVAGRHAHESGVPALLHTADSQ